MSFKGNEGGPVSREMARKWIKNYQDFQSARTSGRIGAKAHFFGKDNILKLLDLEGCMGVRIYYSEDENGDLKPLMVATNSEMQDILPTDNKSISEDGPMILDESMPCPPYCPDTEI
jgi:hypothetical protein